MSLSSRARVLRSRLFAAAALALVLLMLGHPAAVAAVAWPCDADYAKGGDEHAMQPASVGGPAHHAATSESGHDLRSGDGDEHSHSSVACHGGPTGCPGCWVSASIELAAPAADAVAAVLPDAVLSAAERRIDHRPPKPV